MFPASVLLHVLIVGAFYLQWPQMSEAPEEPESVSVELVEPPKEEPPPPPEEKKAEEQKQPEPPPPRAKQEEPPPPPKPAAAAAVDAAIRPEQTQLDERDEAGEQEENGGQEQPKPAEGEQAKADDLPKEEEATQQPTEEMKDAAEAGEKNSPLPPVADSGELPASDAPAETEIANVAVPLPKPQKPEERSASQEASPSGSGNPDLKPARKILAGARPPGPMMRQIFGNLPPRERVQQLCQAEILQQFAAERRGKPSAEGIFYSKRTINDNVWEASGAFNVGPEWYPFEGHCTVNIDRYLVTDFRYDIRPKLSPEEARQRGFRTQ
ncbi:DUF930 domain-containing protein [Agrobacterium larrymoorei]|uniref:DUF930 domain-containing protein n=1 Tax=Agrobacterium larrymoorei TaxID=160699 RepID=A0AAF0H8Z9_9HYPH|nr:DUF930 domain-containing protein [Agrobacterium larrymoorei]WHA42061.1 DUF930 domain-containing protein [Agrobacterium larrymoorei]